MDFVVCESATTYSGFPIDTPPRPVPMPTSSPPPLRLLERPPHRGARGFERARPPSGPAPAPAIGGWTARLRRVWQALRVPA